MLGVDWRDSPKEDKERFTKLCEVSCSEREGERRAFEKEIDLI